jgi:hypothetical protein
LWLVRVQELELLKALSYDRNIVQFYGACILDSYPVLVFECMMVCPAADAFPPFASPASHSPNLAVLSYQARSPKFEGSY